MIKDCTPSPRALALVFLTYEKGVRISAIRTAVISVAGLGARLLPANKAIPKEMLVVVDRPVIQHVIEEAVSAAIRKFYWLQDPARSPLKITLTAILN